MRAREFIIEDQPDNPDSWESQAADAERDAETVRMADQDAAAGGLAEGSDDWATEKEKIRSMTTTQRREYSLARLASTNDDKYAHIAQKAGAGHSEIMNALKGQQGVAEGSKWRNHPDAYEPDDSDELDRPLAIQPKGGYPNDELKGRPYSWAEKGKVTPDAAARKKASIKSSLGKHHKANLPEQGVTEGDLNEKSTSQAQFRTMAAAAHNPKFARKVGISTDVAKEFHSADKKSNYKSLPRKAAEDASWGMAPEGRGYKK